MSKCFQCSRELADEFRFCPCCGTSQRSKIVEYFHGHPGIDDGGLQVSAYLTSPRHLRFSIWRDQRAEAAISLDPDQAHRLGRFLLATVPTRDPSRVAESLRRSAQALREAVSGR